MAVYKVPQDVEADDKLIGPFNFRQFVYLLVAAGLIAIGVALFQVFPLLVLIPLPPVLLFLALALPLKKDQPMETYLAAIVSYYLKPRTRRWMTGQKDTTVTITAPKVVEDVRTRNISQEEATHRLSFLADVIDSGGQSVFGGDVVNNNIMRDDLAAEANSITDMFDTYEHGTLAQAVYQDTAERHNEAIEKMRAAINRTDQFYNSSLQTENTRSNPEEKTIMPLPKVESRANVVSATTTSSVANSVGAKPATIVKSESVAPKQEKTSQTQVDSSIMELANNTDFSVATIAKQANRIKGKEKGEVFISLH